MKPIKNNFTKEQLNTSSIAKPWLFASVFRICIVLVFLILSTQYEYATATNKRLIWTLSNIEKHSDKLEISGVPVQCFIGRGRSRGTFITKVHKGGPGYNSGIKAGDVILRINENVIVNARYVDSAIQSLKGRPANVQIARKHNNSLRVQQLRANWANLASATTTSTTNTANTKELRVINRPKNYKPPTVSIDQLESYFFNLINEDRKKEAGLPPYQRNSTLSALARKYANDQSNRGFTGHRDPEGNMPQDRARLMGINVPICENVAWCSGDALAPAGKVKYCQDSMMNEPPNQQNHRGAILSPVYQYCGVGVAIGKDGKVNVVQEFSTIPVQ